MNDNSITIRELAEGLTKWLKFKRTSAACAEELPTVEMAVNQFEKKVAAAAKDEEQKVKTKLLNSNDPRSIELLTLLSVWGSHKDGKQLLNLGQYIPPEYKKEPLAVLVVKTKEVEEDGKTRVVPLSVEPYDTETGHANLRDLLCSMARNCQQGEPRFFERWKHMPLEFRRKNPICPVCGAPARILPQSDYSSAGILACHICDWESHSQKLYPDDAADVKVMEKERKFANGADAAKREVEAAEAEVKAALKRLQEAQKNYEKYFGSGTAYKKAIDRAYEMDDNPEEEGDIYKAIAYDDETGAIHDWAPFDSAEEAIEFAKSHNWDTVENVVTGEVLYRR